MERTLITVVAFIWSGLLLWHFGMTTESVTISLPIVTAVMAYWFAGANTQPVTPPKPPEPPPTVIVNPTVEKIEAPKGGS